VVLAGCLPAQHRRLLSLHKLRCSPQRRKRHLHQHLRLSLPHLLHLHPSLSLRQRAICA
jgi:hypothetical protein